MRACLAKSQGDEGCSETRCLPVSAHRDCQAGTECSSGSSRRGDGAFQAVSFPLQGGREESAEATVSVAQLKGGVVRQMESNTGSSSSSIGSTSGCSASRWVNNCDIQQGQLQRQAKQMHTRQQGQQRRWYELQQQAEWEGGEGAHEQQQWSRTGLSRGTDCSTIDCHDRLSPTSPSPSAARAGHAPPFLLTSLRLSLLLPLLLVSLLAACLPEARGDFITIPALNDQQAVVVAKIKDQLFGPSPLITTPGFNATTKVICYLPYNGLSCDADGYVTKIHWDGFDDVQGTLSPLVGKLSRLKYLSVASSSVTGGIPASISSLTRLTHFNLSNNLLSGPLPPGIMRMPSLQVIDVSNNSLSSALPAACPPSLRRGNFSFNLFSGPIPAPLWFHPTLSALDLSHNRFVQSLPSPAATLPSPYLVGSRDASSNQLSGVVPPAMSLAMHIMYLNISRNRLTGALPPSLGHAQLVSLDLSFNSLSGPLPATILCPKLHTLLLANNSFQESIPDVAAPLALSTFDVSSNRLSGSLPTRLFPPSLAHLNVAGNTLNGSLPTSILSSSSLTYLNASFNFFSGQLPRGLFSAPVLVAIDLSHNSFSGSFPASGRGPVLESLSFLSVSYNRLAGQIPDLPAFPSLLHIGLSSNLFSGTLPPSLCLMPSIKRIDISNNKLSGMMPFECGAASTLRYLNAAFNNMSGVVPPLPPSLNHLDLSYNRFSGIENTSLGSLNRLTYLSISSNQLNIPLSPIICRGQLRVLRMRNCGLYSSIPPCLFPLQSIRQLDLSNNMLVSDASQLPSIGKDVLVDLSNNYLFGSSPLSDEPTLSCQSPPLLTAAAQLPFSVIATLLSRHHNDSSSSSSSISVSRDNSGGRRGGNSNSSDGDDGLIALPPGVELLDLRGNCLAGVSCQRSDGDCLSVCGINKEDGPCGGRSAGICVAQISPPPTSPSSPSPAPAPNSASVPTSAEGQAGIKGLYSPLPSQASIAAQPALISPTGTAAAAGATLSGTPSVPVSTAQLPRQGPGGLPGQPGGGGGGGGGGGLPGGGGPGLGGPGPRPGGGGGGGGQGGGNGASGNSSGTVLVPAPAAPPVPPPPPSMKFVCECSKGYNLKQLAPPSQQAICVPPAPPQEQAPPLSPGAIIGLVVGAFALALLVALGLYFFFFRPRRHAAPHLVHCPLIPIEDIRAATENFAESRQIGEGAFGTVYRGLAKDGTEWAVKRAKLMTNAFETEVRTVAGLRHRNLVRLLGYCVDYNASNGQQEQILVYEFVPGGDLSHFIHLKAGFLPFAVRLQIAVGAAEGIAYLHECSSPPTVHRDIKPGNILVSKDKDHHYQAKIADFGLLKSENLQSMTRVTGTPGYVDPDYSYSHVVTPKSDVYSFGIVLLELLSAREVTLGSDGQHISRWAYELMSSGQISSVAEPGLNAPEDLLLEMIDVAMDCIKRPGALRPSMRDVATRLAGIHTRVQQEGSEEDAVEAEKADSEGRRGREGEAETEQFIEGDESPVRCNTCAPIIVCS